MKCGTSGKMNTNWMKWWMSTISPMWLRQWTGIPVTQMMETESQKLLQMEDRLHEQIIGQEEAIMPYLMPYAARVPV